MEEAGSGVVNKAPPKFGIYGDSLHCVCGLELLFTVGYYETNHCPLDGREEVCDETVLYYGCDEQQACREWNINWTLSISSLDVFLHSITGRLRIIG